MDEPSILEVGGGRSPSFGHNLCQTLNCDYTVNDIDPRELDRAPSWVGRLEGDISDPNLCNSGETFDLVFSRMVFEHIDHPQQAYQNICAMLSMRGLFVNFIPTLYSLPFVVNGLFPHALTEPLLRTFHPQRNPDEVPKFPAYYRWCSSTNRTKTRIASTGFRDVQIIPFYGHGYYDPIPILRDMHSWVARLSRQFGTKWLSSYAYIIAER
jgi:SAM-dependent methyltransferase